MKLNNINIYSKDNVKEFIKIVEPEVTSYEQFIIDEVSKESDLLLVNFPCGFDKFASEVGENYLGLDTRRRLIDQSKDKNKNTNYNLISLNDDSFEIKDECILFNSNFLNRVLDPIQFIEKTLDKIKSKKLYFSIQFAKDGKELNSEPSLIRLKNNSRFIYTIFSKKAVKEIAKQFNLSIKEFKHNEDNYAVLYSKEKKKKSKKVDQ